MASNAAAVELADLLRDMQHCIRWDVAKDYLHAVGLPKGHGWEPTFAKAEKLTSVDPQAIEILAGKYIIHSIHGDKYVRVIEDPTGEYSFPSGALAIDVPINTPFAKIAEILRSKTAGDLPTSAMRLKSKGGTAIFFKSRRQIETQTILSTAEHDIPVSVAQNFDSIIAYKTDTREVYDVVWAPAGKKRIEFRIDAHEQTNSDVMQGALLRLEHAYRELIGKSVLAPPKNIYNAIAGLYKVSTGIVTELGFVTGTGSVKHERMRRDRDCLRTELFHKSGAEAIKGDFLPFRIGVRWKPKDITADNPELHIRGTSQLVHKAMPVYYDFYVTKTTSHLSFDNVVTEVISRC